MQYFQTQPSVQGMAPKRRWGMHKRNAVEAAHLECQQMFKRSSSRRQWREVPRSYGNSSSRGSEAARSSRYSWRHAWLEPWFFRRGFEWNEVRRWIYSVATCVASLQGSTDMCSWFSLHLNGSELPTVNSLRGLWLFTGSRGKQALVSLESLQAYISFGGDTVVWKYQTRRYLLHQCVFVCRKRGPIMRTADGMWRRKPESACSSLLVILSTRQRLFEVLEFLCVWCFCFRDCLKNNWAWENYYHKIYCRHATDTHTGWGVL